MKSLIRPLAILRLCLFFFFLIWSDRTIAQCPPGSVTFYNQGQIDYFLVEYPNCTQINGTLVIAGDASSVISSLAPLHNITTIQGGFRLLAHATSPSNLNGLENLTYIGGNLYLFDTWLSDISGLQNLAYVGGDVEVAANDFCDFSPLSNITHFGGNVLLGSGNTCSDNNFVLGASSIPGNFYYGVYTPNTYTLAGLAGLTSVGGDFTLASANVTDLEGLGALQSVGGIFSVQGSIENQPIASLDGIDSLTSIGGLHLQANNYLTDISALNQITSLPQGLHINNNAQLASLSGLENVASVSGSFIVENNPSLTSIDEFADTDLSQLEYLHIGGNTQLPMCHHLNICNYLYGDGERVIGSNAAQCGDEAAVTLACNQTYRNTVTGHVRIDFNADGCTASDEPMGNIKVQVFNSTNTYTTFTDADGSYTLYVPDGAYFVQAFENVANFSFTPPIQPIEFGGVGETQTIDFCATAIQTVNDVRIVVTPNQPPRPGFETTFIVKYKNVGTVTANGSVNFTFDPAMMAFSSATTPVSSQNANVLTWNYSNLLPFEERRFTVRFNVFAPPTVIDGQHLAISASVNPIPGDATPADNVFALGQTVVNSYDPNDKTALLGPLLLWQNIGNYLYYTIRFQNTGTASAVNVKVVDTFLPTLYPGSFELLDMSHNGRVQMHNEKAEFLFDNINLPDSTADEPNSHGYITFRIKPGTVSVGSLIHNAASIYFDFNDAIVTENSTVLVDTDSDNDGLINSIDNCDNTPNIDQTDSDNDGIGDVCDDNVEVNPPYAIGFDTATLDPLWRVHDPAGSMTSVTVSNLNDVDAAGNTIRMYTQSTAYTVLLIAPRLNHVSTQSTITFWAVEEGNAFLGRLRVGFMTDPNNPNTFTSLQSINPPETMTQYTVNMANYVPSMGKNLAFLVEGRTIFVDDFVYDSPLGIPDREAPDFAIYPNPADDRLYVESQAPIDGITVFDSRGRVLKRMVSAQYIELSDLSHGLYYIEFRSGDRKQTKKFIKK